jgi:uncharacterized protein
MDAGSRDHHGTARPVHVRWAIRGGGHARIAWALTTEVIRRCDMHVEVHTGDGAEWLEPFVGVYGGKLAAAQYAQSRTIGLAFGFQNVIKYSMVTQEQVDWGRSLNRQAVADGRPTVLVECCGFARPSAPRCPSLSRT